MLYWPKQSWIHAFCTQGKRVEPSKEQRLAAYRADRNYGQDEMMLDIERMLTGDESANGIANVSTANIPAGGESANGIANESANAPVDRAEYMRNLMRKKREADKARREAEREASK